MTPEEKDYIIFSELYGKGFDCKDAEFVSAYEQLYDDTKYLVYGY